MLIITRKDLLLTISDNVIPAMGSSDVPVKFVNDTETYVDFLIEPRVGYYINGCPKSTVCEYSSNTIKIPAEAFKNKGILVIAIALIDNADSNHIEVTKELSLEVTPAPNGTVILPATDTWQTAVKNLVEQLYNQDYKPQFDQIEEDLSSLVEEAENQQSKAKEQQTQIDNAIDIMGDYEIVQDNPTQIRFKKGNGEFGDTVNLGDNLASKSMVNAGYDTYSGNSYSGSASDYGIEIGKASGAYEQEGTPTPESPIEPKFFEPTEFVSHSKNLLDNDNIANYFDKNYGTYNGYKIKNLKPNTKYIMSTNVPKSEPATLYLGGIMTTFNGVFANEPKTVGTNANGEIDFYIRTDNSSGYKLDDFVNGKYYIQLEEGENATPYNDYKGQSTTPLNITLRALPNGVKDTYENGVITRRIGVANFDGSGDEAWQFFTSTGVNQFHVTIENMKYDANSIPILCNKFKSILLKNRPNNYNTIYSGETVFCINIEAPTDVSGWKTWLQSNPITVWYELAEPYTEQVDLPVIPSYFPFTNAWHDSEVEASDLTWNILARQYGSGQTTIKKDEAVLTELDLNTERTATPTTVKVQLQDVEGNTFYVETSADNVYLKGTDGTEITQKNLNDKIGQLINLVAFYSANPTTVLADLKKYITTIS